jgi:hypothetical protein
MRPSRHRVNCGGFGGEKTAMTVPFSKVAAGLESARLRQVEWAQVLAHARPDSEQAVKARAHLDWLDLYIGAETKLLAYLRRQWALYEMFPTADKPAELVRWFHLWTDVAPRSPPTQLKLPLKEKK